jgi:hypothetical protein
MKARRCIEVMIASPEAHRVLRPEDIQDLAIRPYGEANETGLPGRGVGLSVCTHVQGARAAVVWPVPARSSAENHGRGKREAEGACGSSDWRSPKGGSLTSGDYFAHWVKRDGAWLTVAEVYVALHCNGPVCAP